MPAGLSRHACTSPLAKNGPLQMSTKLNFAGRFGRIAGGPAPTCILKGKYTHNGQSYDAYATQGAGYAKCKK